jgi:type I restriction enzyme M protein
VFNPYTGIKTNLLFFTKGRPTREVWFYEHPYPAGVKNYSKTRPMRLEEFAAEEAWWTDRQETAQAWKVSLDEIRERNWNLDCKNPHVGEQVSHDPEVLLAEYRQMQAEIAELQGQLKAALVSALER